MKRFFAFFVILFLLFSTHSTAFAVTDIFFKPEDSYVRESSPGQNYGSDTILIADGVAQDPDNGIFGEVVTLAQWDLSSIPPTATVTGVNLLFHYSNSSSGPYNIYPQNSAWSEGTVTWNDLDQGGPLLGTIPPFSSGQGIHPLNADGIALVQGWVDGSIDNNGLMVRSGGTNDGIAMDSRESGGRPPTLEITYRDIKSHFYTVGPCQFRGRDSTEKTLCGIGTGGVSYDGPSRLGIVAPVNLPHGAVIKNITVHYLDTNPSVRLFFDFQRERLAAGSFQTIGEGFSNTGLGFQSISFGPVPVISPRVNNLVDSLSFQTVAVRETDRSLIPWPTDSSLLVKGVVIEYILP